MGHCNLTRPTSSPLFKLLRNMETEEILSLLKSSEALIPMSGVNGRVPLKMPHAAYEDVVLLRDLTADSKELEEIKELTMQVACDDHRQSHWLDIVFLYQNLLQSLASQLQQSLRQDVMFARHELVDPLIEVESGSCHASQQPGGPLTT